MNAINPTTVNHNEFYPIPGFDGYSISPGGTIVSTRNGRWKNCPKTRELKGWVDVKGYHHVGLMRDGKVKSMAVHKLQELTFLGGPKPGLQIDHIDGNKDNNDVSNLRQVTPLGNTHNPVTRKRQLDAMRTVSNRTKLSISIRKKIEEDPDYKERLTSGLRRCRAIPEWCAERAKLQKEIMQRPEMQRMIYENLQKMNGDPEMRKYNAERSKAVNSRVCKAINNDGRELTFNSVTDCAAHFGCVSGTITRYMRDSVTTKEGWHFCRPDKEKKE